MALKMVSSKPSDVDDTKLTKCGGCNTMKLQYLFLIVAIHQLLLSEDGARLVSKGSNSEAISCSSAQIIDTIQSPTSGV